MKKTLLELGEFNFISEIAKRCKEHKTVIKGIGDDTAVVEFTKDKFLLLTADMLIENVHFTRFQPPDDIGHKAIACSISDIAAMGGMPHYALVSIAFPKNLALSFAKKIYKGIQDTAGVFEISIVGGDTNCADKIVIDVFICGIVEKKKLVLRNGARQGDCIFVTGSLGGSQAGKHLRFTPRLKQARFLVSNYPLNSMIDISDGLVSDLGHIVTQSKVGAILFEDAIPLSRNVYSVDDAYYTGEDFELLFTMPKKYSKQLLSKWPFKKKVGLSCIGEIIIHRKGIFVKDKDSRIKKIKKGGYEHFR